MNNHGDGFLAENLEKLSTTTKVTTTIDSTFRTPPPKPTPSSSSMIETNNTNNHNHNHNHHYSNDEPNQIGQTSNGSSGFFVKQPEKFLSTKGISLTSEPLSPTTTNTTATDGGGSTSKMANNNNNNKIIGVGVGVGGENGGGGGGGSSSSSSSLIKTITAEVYQQFDQLVTTTNNKKTNTNNNNNNDSNSNKLTKNNDFGQLNKRSKTNSLSGLHNHKPQTNQVNNRRRDRIKSFIEFDDNYDDYDDDDDGDGDDWNYRTDGGGQRLASKDHHHHRGRSQLRKSSPSLQNEYRNELIDVFEPHNITIPTTKICHENVDDNVDVDGVDDVEWNDFQTSEPAAPPPPPPPPPPPLNDGDRNNNNNDDHDHDQDHGDNSTTSTTTDSTDSDNSDNNNINLNDNNFDEANLDLINGGDGGGGGGVGGAGDPECDNMFLYGKLNRMEEEQEFLNNSLIALTSHFAQVQLRLRQIVEAKDLDQSRRETLLAELETFANRGIPELMLSTTGNPSVNHSTNNLKRSVSMATSLMADDVFDDDDDDDDGRSQKSMATNNHIDDLVMVANDDNNDDQESEIDGATIDGHHHQQHQRGFSRPRYWSYSSQMDEDSLMQHSLASMATNMTKNSSASKLLITEEKLERQRTRQKELITQLKEQLEDLERYAYETGELNSLPSSMLLERQNAIIEQLKSKLPVLSIDEIDNLTPDQLRNKVDHAIKELVNPVIMKEQLVTQLKTQVTDLERFIEFLQQGGAKMKHKHKRVGGGGGSYLMKFLKKTSLNTSSSTKTIHQDAAISSNHLDGHRRHNRISSNDSDRRRNSDERNNNSNIDGATTTRSKGGAVKSGGKSRSQHHSQHTTTTTTTTTMDHNGRSSQSAAESADSIFKRILSLLHMFAWTQLGTCASFSGQNNNYDNTNHNHPNDDRTRSSTTTRVPPPFQQNILKRTTPICARHWGDLRAHLEMVINSILDFYKEQNLKIYETTSKSKSSPRPANINETAEAEADDDDNVVDDCDVGDEDSAADQPARASLMIDNYYAFEQMTILVRKELSISLRNLIQHGMIGCVMADAAGTDATAAMAKADSISAAMMINHPSSSIPITTVGGYLLNIGLGCFNSRSGLIGGGGGRTPSIHTSRRPMHAWQLILYYYELKHGNKFRSTPTRRLSQSFGLQVMAGVHTNPKHSLLAAIDDIIDSHTRLKRSLDSHFKAFVSIALNQQMLSKWLRLILRNPTIMTDCYEKWSYTASTGFEDALRQLDKLSELKFCLPTDLAVRQLQSIHDAF